MDMNYVDSFDLFGIPVRQKACKPGSGAPTTTAEGAVGDLYMDTITGDIYKCTGAKDGQYTWELFGSGTGGGSVTNDIPAYWEDTLDQKIKTIKALQAEGGKDCFSFVAIADVHHAQNLGKCSPTLAKRIMDECNIKFAMCLGDMQNQAATNGESGYRSEWDNINKMFEPIRDRTLMQLGNHDGAWGQLDKNSDGTVSGLDEYYCYNFKPEELFEYALRRTSLIDGVHFDDSGNGYWVDDSGSKVRYIMLNTNAVVYEENADGTAVNNVMRKFNLMQSQVDMLVDALKTVPTDNWSVVIGSHAPLAQWGEGVTPFSVVASTLRAYQNKTAFAGTYGTEGEWNYVAIDVDFTNAKGTLAGAFAGHIHKDLSAIIGNVPYVCVSADSKWSDDMVAGTATEQSFDVVTINRKNGKIYCTKIGYGADRVIPEVNYTNLVDTTSPDFHVGTYFIKGDNANGTGMGSLQTNGSVTAKTVVTNFIPAVKGDILRFKGFERETTPGGYSASFYAYDENKELVTRVQLTASKVGTMGALPVSSVEDENGVTNYTVLFRGDTNQQYVYNNCCDKARYIRFCAEYKTSVEDLVVTINEEIE